MHEILARAREIEALNTQLDQKIQDRSRELSMALARLAEDHHPLAPGTVLGDRVEIDALLGQGGMGSVSPEQISAPETVDGRADVYALGVVLYLAVAGRLPYEGGSARSWLVAHAVAAPVDLSAQVAEVDPELARLVMACLDKDPDERPAAADLGSALAAIADRAGAPGLETLDLRSAQAPARAGSEAETIVRSQTLVSGDRRSASG